MALAIGLVALNYVALLVAAAAEIPGDKGPVNSMDSVGWRVVDLDEWAADRPVSHGDSGDR